MTAPESFLDTLKRKPILGDRKPLGSQLGRLSPWASTRSPLGKFTTLSLPTENNSFTGTHIAARFVGLPSELGDASAFQANSDSLDSPFPKSKIGPRRGTESVTPSPFQRASQTANVVQAKTLRGQPLQSLGSESLSTELSATEPFGTEASGTERPTSEASSTSNFSSASSPLNQLSSLVQRRPLGQSLHPSRPPLLDTVSDVGKPDLSPQLAVSESPTIQARSEDTPSEQAEVQASDISRKPASSERPTFPARSRAITPQSTAPITSETSGVKNQREGTVPSPASPAPSSPPLQAKAQPQTTSLETPLQTERSETRDAIIGSPEVDGSEAPTVQARRRAITAPPPTASATEPLTTPSVQAALEISSTDDSSEAIASSPVAPAPTPSSPPLQAKTQPQLIPLEIPLQAERSEVGESIPESPEIDGSEAPTVQARRPAIDTEPSTTLATNLLTTPSVQAALEISSTDDNRQATESLPIAPATTPSAHSLQTKAQPQLTLSEMPLQPERSGAGKSITEIPEIDGSKASTVQVQRSAIAAKTSGETSSETSTTENRTEEIPPASTITSSPLPPSSQSPEPVLQAKPQEQITSRNTQTSPSPQPTHPPASQPTPTPERKTNLTPNVKPLTPALQNTVSPKTVSPETVLPKVTPLNTASPHQSKKISTPELSETPPASAEDSPILPSLQLQAKSIHPKSKLSTNPLGQRSPLIEPSTITSAPITISTGPETISPRIDSAFDSQLTDSVFTTPSSSAVQAKPSSEITDWQAQFEQEPVQRQPSAATSVDASTSLLESASTDLPMALETELISHSIVGDRADEKGSEQGQEDMLETLAGVIYSELRDHLYRSKESIQGYAPHFSPWSRSIQGTTGGQATNTKSIGSHYGPCPPKLHQLATAVRHQVESRLRQEVGR